MPPSSAAVSFDCVALAWNGSPEAIRSIHAARALLVRARRVVVLEGTPRERFAEMGWKPAFDLFRYLKDQGITAEATAISDDADTGAALLEAAGRLNADMLVMGAYGRTRFSEWVLGGATRHVLHHATLPVFFRH